MINLLLALGAGVLVAVLIHVIGFSWLAGIFPGVLAILAVYVLLARRIATQVQALGELAQAPLQSVRSEKERAAGLDKAIKILEGGFAFARWQFFIAPEIHANIGMLMYLKRDFEQARPHLEAAFGRNWMAKSMLGCIHYQAKQEAPMKAAFEESVGGGTGKKDPLAWAVYAWCLENSKKHEDAVVVASRAVTENPSDEKLKKLQNQLQNGKRLKMNQFEPMWWQFGFEQPTAQMPQVRFQRGRRR